MGKSVFFTACAVCIIFCGATAHGAVVDIVCRDHIGQPLPASVWSFDYSSQVLTINETVTEIRPDRIPYDWEHEVHVSGLHDSDTTFTIAKHITNETSVALTSYEQDFILDLGGLGRLVEGSAESEEFPEIAYLYYGGEIRFSGPDPILPGESFTIRFNMYCAYDPDYPDYRFSFHLVHRAVPEPATVLTLALGSLVVLRNRRARKQPSHTKLGSCEL